MKKILLGTTALATAVLISAGAQAAAEPVSLKISGYFKGLVAFGDNGVTDARNVAVKSWDSEVHFTAKGVADNGLTYGARIELEGNTTGNQIDEAFLFFEGGFGKIEVGYDDSVAYQMLNTSPAPDKLGMLALNTPNYAWGGATAQTLDALFNNDAAKLIYFTPRLAGFQLGVSYAPDVNYNNNATSIGSDADFTLDNDAAYGQGTSVGLNYNQKLSTVTVGLSATYSWYEAELAPDDASYWGLGASLGFGIGEGTLTVGGSYAENNDRFASGVLADTQAYDVGVKYAMGPWSLGANYIWQDYGRSSDDEMWGASVGGGYTLAPGLELSAGYIHYDRDASLTTVPADGDASADVFVLGTGLSF
ncbi:porin [Oleomonas cavernae]|uniref:Porin n=1 Tax=Oleomonas cavernae TaxID=2320859 RepID=A0A418WHW6_9PROT|nr:porin [Oleomonas cavernae]RJF89636.1 porin [Oleomonas cavernae]